jgi:predicted N-formylglutamate amidohydrolase
MASALGVELIAAETTRLLVDLNRSLDNPSLFSKYSNRLTAFERDEVLRSYYRPYREQVESVIGDGMRRRARETARVVHLSVHTFTPRMAGIWRPIDIGLLFDPASPTETDICTRWQEGMLKTHRRLRVVPNLPYAGTDDGLTTYLRTRWPASDYAGIEIEINHRFFKRSRETQRKIVQALLETFPRLEN